MDYRAFSQGVEPGGLNDTNHIRILICYLLHRLEMPVSRDIINEALIGQGLVNYFELEAAYGQLMRRGMIEKNESDGHVFFSVTPLGGETAHTLMKDVPFTVREKALDRILKLMNYYKNLKQNHVDITETENGFNVTCAVLDGSLQLMSVTVLTATRDEAEHIRDQFLNDPETVYKGILSVMVGSFDPVGGLMAFQKNGPEKNR